MAKPIIFNAQECPESRVEKAWGHEIIFENNEKYCGKLLVFKKGRKFSMHYHMIKDETWYVQEGEFIYTWIDTEKAEPQSQHLFPGDAVRVPPGHPHQLEAVTDATMFEVSTEHFDYDSYRVWKGDTL